MIHFIVHMVVRKRELQAAPLSSHINLIERGVDIFCWIPCHIDIQKGICKVNLPYTDFRSNFIKYIRRLYQDEWDLQVHNKRHAIHPAIGYNS